MKPLAVRLVGCGAIGHGVIAGLVGDTAVRVMQIVVPGDEARVVRREFADIAVASDFDDLPEKPALMLECAGHAAVTGHVLPALERGIDCIMCSIGALAEPGLPERLESAARTGGATLQLISGAIGGIDALAAARIGGLASVVYTGRKPPRGWKDTPAEDRLDLDQLGQAATFFEGSARDAARLFPKNANVAATVSLAGLGLDRTKVQLIADPAVSRNVHHIQAEGAFGELEVKLSGRPLASNPKTSALVVYSALRALRNRGATLVI